MSFHKFYICSFFRVQNIKYSSQGLFYAVYFNITSISPRFVLLHRVLAWYKIKGLKEKQRQAARTPNVFFVVASHYQSLQIVVLLLQACLLGSLGLSRTLLLQQLHRLQQDRRFRLFASLFRGCLKTASVASCLRER